MAKRTLVPVIKPKQELKIATTLIKSKILII